MKVPGIDRVERRGVVVGFQDGLAGVRMEVEAACASCGSRSACSTGKAGQTVALELPKATRIGDTVSVTIPAASITRAALLGYLLPPLALLFGAYFAGFVRQGDGAAVIGAGLGFVAGLLTVRLIAGRFPGLAAAPFACSSESHHSNRFQSGENL